MRRRLPELLAIFAVSILILACFGRLVARPGDLIVDGERPSVDDFQKIEPRGVGNDLTQLFLPHHLRIAAEVARGGLPSAWDSGGFCGRPRVGNPQAGLFYPPVWLAWWSARPAALGWLTVMHLVFAGAGVFSLSRRFSCGLFASVIASGVFVTSPYVLAQVFEGHYPHVWGACWSPWAFLAADALRKGDFRGVLALPLILTMASLTGHPQEAYYLTIAIAAWLAGDAILAIRRKQSRRAVGSLACFAGVLALTVGLAAIELFPDAEAARWGRKADRMTIAEASKYHVDFLNFTQLVGPRALGGPSDFFGHDNYWETVLSIGWIPLVLAAVGARYFPGRKAAKGWAGLAIVSVVFALGWRLGLFAVLYETVPGMDRFRVPARSLFLASLAGAILAGFGVEAIRSGAIGMGGLDWPKQRRRFLILLAILGIGEAVARSRHLEGRESLDRPGLSESRDRRPRSSREREIGRWALAASRLVHDPSVWVALGGSAAAMAWLHRRPWDGRRVAIGLGTLAWLELAWNGLGLIQTAPPSRFLGPDPVAETIANENIGRPFRIRARDGFYTDLKALAAGLEKTNLNDSFQVGRAEDLYGVLYPIYGPFRSVIDQGAMAEEVRTFRKEVRQAVLDRLGVAFLVTDRAPPGAPWPVVEVGDWGDARYTIYRNPTAMPRAYVVPRAEIVEETRSGPAGFLRSPPKGAVLMASDPLKPGGIRQQFKPALYESGKSDRVVVSVDTEAPGLLVMADTWMPGWSATLDGKPTPILRGNHAQRVIPLPEPGRHRVEMKYEPPGFRAGIAVSAASAAIWLIAGLAMLGRRRRAINPSAPFRLRARRPIACSLPSRISSGCSRSS